MYKTLTALFACVSIFGCVDKNDNPNNAGVSSIRIAEEKKYDSTELDKLIAIQQKIWKVLHESDTEFP